MTGPAGCIDEGGVPQPQDGGGFAPLPPGGPCDVVRHGVAARRLDGAEPGRFCWGPAGVGVGEDLSVADAHGLQEALLAERERNGGSPSSMSWGSVKCSCRRSQRSSSQCGVPGNGHGPSQRRALAVVEPLRGASKSRMSSTWDSVTALHGEHGPLAAAVLAVDGLGDVEPAASLIAWSVTPWRKKASQALLNAFITGGLCSRIAWLSGRGVRAVQAGPLHDRYQFRIGHCGGVDVADVSHRASFRLLVDKLSKT